MDREAPRESSQPRARYFESFVVIVNRSSCASVYVGGGSLSWGIFKPTSVSSNPSSGSSRDATGARKI